jgi:hypothetical protein
MQRPDVRRVLVPGLDPASDVDGVTRGFVMEGLRHSRAQAVQMKRG